MLRDKLLVIRDTIVCTPILPCDRIQTAMCLAVTPLRRV